MTRAFGALAMAAAVAAGGATWMLASEHSGPEPKGTFVPRRPRDWPVSAERAEGVRNAALRRADVRVADPTSIDLDVVEPDLACRFLASQPTGTSPKFDCVLDGGEILKVKYGGNPEVRAEVAATRLLNVLGFATDRMTLAGKVRCHGCPRSPFAAMRLLHLTGAYRWYRPDGASNGFTDFAWAAVERRFEGAAIDLPDRKGWAWWELDAVDPRHGASRTDLDALRLAAVFLAHWDNKDDNQRLVCLDPPGAVDTPCTRPLLMIHDLGATFGPEKADVTRWAALPIWSDAATCTVSMDALPYRGGTFPDARITEAARARVGRRLSAIADDQIASLFARARFPDGELAAWRRAFRDRVRQVTETGPCPN